MTESRPVLGVVMDPIETIKPRKDSTLAMMLAAQRAGWSLVYFRQHDLMLMIRSSVSGELFACNVAIARWPVPARSIAACIVSRSRISPIRITSGASRIALRSARWYECVSRPTSR